MVTVLITGTPGTGKTSVSRILSRKLKSPILDLNDLVEEKHLYSGKDPEKGYKVVDLDALSMEIQGIIEDSSDEHMIVEGHLSHYFKKEDLVDLVVVLRARPNVLIKRLKRRAWSESKVQENIEAEALDICTFEAVETYGEKVNEIDTTDIGVEEVTDIIIEVMDGKKNFPPGNIDFLKNLLDDTHDL
jgi:adenylate kinase